VGRLYRNDDDGGSDVDDDGGGGDVVEERSSVNKILQRVRHESFGLC